MALGLLVGAVMAHPRMRGEHCLDAGTGTARRGSSPHARGARRRVRGVVRGAGLIPACAGSTPSLAMGTFRVAAHPRMRGEHARAVRFLRASGWLIPACAGSTPTSKEESMATGAHPRMRGEHRCGSLHDLRGRRLIPACAGSTPAGGGKPHGRWAHPRMRGEHFTRSFDTSDWSGSSPHARGALRGVTYCTSPRRLIPACAGSTGPGASGRPWTAAHPRMRGEHVSSYWLVCLLSGSSPHARGARGGSSSGCRRGRLIPACAGSTCRMTRSTPWRTAHPRMRGEHTPGGPGSPRSPGSSPHARGAHLRQ